MGTIGAKAKGIDQKACQSKLQSAERGVFGTCDGTTDNDGKSTECDCGSIAIKGDYYGLFEGGWQRGTHSILQDQNESNQMIILHIRLQLLYSFHCLFVVCDCM